MSELENLRPEIRDAVDSLDKSEGIDFAWLAVRADLVRVARENDEWQTRCLQFQTERDKARAKLAALEARIAEAHVEEWVDEAGATVHMAFVPLLQNESPSALIHEPQDDNAKEGRIRE